MKTLLNYSSYCLIMPLHTTKVFNSQQEWAQCYGGVLHSLEEEKITVFHEKKKIALFFWINELIFREKKSFCSVFLN